MAVRSVRSVRTKENPMNMEDLLRKAIAAEAKATRRKSKDVARVWALTYAEAAVALFVKDGFCENRARGIARAEEQHVVGLVSHGSGPWLARRLDQLHDRRFRVFVFDAVQPVRRVERGLSHIVRL